MKNLLKIAATYVAVLSLIVAGASMTSGCKHITNPDGSTTVVPTLNPDQVAVLATGAQMATAYGVQLAIAKDPATKAYFQLAAQTLTLLATTNALDAATVDNALQSLNVNGVSDQQIVRAAIISALGAYSVLEGQVVTAQLDKVVYLKPMLLAIINGIDSAVGTAAPAGKAVYHSPKALQPIKGSAVWPHPISH